MRKNIGKQIVHNGRLGSRNCDQPSNPCEDKGSQWERACQVLLSMLAEGPEPNPGQFKATSPDLTLNGGLCREQYRNDLKLGNDFSKLPRNHVSLIIRWILMILHDPQ